MISLASFKPVAKAPLIIHNAAKPQPKVRPRARRRAPHEHLWHVPGSEGVVIFAILTIFNVKSVHAAPKKGPPFLDTRARMCREIPETEQGCQLTCSALV